MDVSQLHQKLLMALIDPSRLFDPRKFIFIIIHNVMLQRIFYYGYYMLCIYFNKYTNIVTQCNN